jgi:transcriptional regulator with PAS, ATPase and Fis domain
VKELLDDIPMLVRYFVSQFARRMHKPIDTITFDTMQGLSRYA